MRLYHRLLLAATLLAVIVIGLGAYVRLSDSGLGFPDWPGFFGPLFGVPGSAHRQMVGNPALKHQFSGKSKQELVQGDHVSCCRTLP